MRKPLMRIPYTDLLSPSSVIPRSATTLTGAIAALRQFFASPTPTGLPESTVVLSGAGLSVSSGLADYRGINGTYRVNKAYRPTYYSEFISNHEARKRYWARSFLGWTTLHKASPNAGHFAIRDLGQLGLVKYVITQNVDSFHSTAHPDMPIVELHGYLRSTICTSCREEFPRDAFQDDLARLNPAWAAVLAEALAAGVLDPGQPGGQKLKGIRTNPDGDVDLPGAPYTTFRYPACPKCLSDPPTDARGNKHTVEVDGDGAWKSSSSAGILKPAVVMFGENISRHVKTTAEEAIDQSGRLLVLGTSLATYSAWRLAKRAKDRGMPIAIVNIGGVRGEEVFYTGLHPEQSGSQGVRVEYSTDVLLPTLVEELRHISAPAIYPRAQSSESGQGGFNMFKDMLS
jgi:NAD+-dependent protein deacetylase sirtuin 4